MPFATSMLLYVLFIIPIPWLNCRFVQLSAVTSTNPHMLTHLGQMPICVAVATFHPLPFSIRTRLALSDNICKYDTVWVTLSKSFYKEMKCTFDYSILFNLDFESCLRIGFRIDMSIYHHRFFGRQPFQHTPWPKFVALGYWDILHSVPRCHTCW